MHHCKSDASPNASYMQGLCRLVIQLRVDNAGTTGSVQVIAIYVPEIPTSDVRLMVIWLLSI